MSAKHNEARPKKGRGGARPGSGKPPIGSGPSVNLAVRVSPEMDRALRAAADRAGMSLSDFARDAFERRLHQLGEPGQALAGDSMSGSNRS